MKKLSLRADELRVESFHTTPADDAKGTVFGEECTCYTCTCPGCPTCDYTCRNTCVQTCAYEYTCDTCMETCANAPTTCTGNDICYV